MDLDIVAGREDSRRPDCLPLMTTRFWFHVSVSAALAVAVCLFVWLQGAAVSPAEKVPDTPTARGATLILTFAFLFAFARLLLRSTGSDRTMGLLGLYAALLCLPFVVFVTASPSHAAAMLLLTAALLEILDVDLSHANAWRSGLYAAVACVVEPNCAVLVAALFPVVAAVAGPRWKLTVRFVLAVSIPWVFATRILDLGRPESGFFPIRHAAMLGAPGGWASAPARLARDLRSSLESEFLSPYAAFASAGLVVATVRRMGPSRRGIAAAAWLLSIAILASTVLGESTAAFFRSVAYLWLILLANTGLAALAAMNPLHAGRRRMIPAGALFLLPAVIGWLRVLV